MNFYRDVKKTINISHYKILYFLTKYEFSSVKNLKAHF